MTTLAEQWQMQFRALTKIVAGIKYKSGWFFSVDQRFDEPPILIIRVNAIDVTDIWNGGLKGQFSVETYAPSMFVDDVGLLSFVFRIIRNIEEHEAGEFFMFNGVRVFNPHVLATGTIDEARITASAKP